MKKIRLAIVGTGSIAFTHMYGIQRLDEAELVAIMDIHKEQIAEFDTEIRLIPQFDPESPMMISQGPSICIFNKEDPCEVLASWLFAQFLLTNEVQLGYAMTEGYVPVTLKAQGSAEYLDYLSREGEDNNLYYDIKIKASKLLIENTENTFITPVFNGSASLRNAAGQMIEEVTKSIKRKQTVDDAYMEALYSNMNALYHLDTLGPQDYEKQELGGLPPLSVALVSVICAVWLLLGAYFAYGAIKKRKK